MKRLHVAFVGEVDHGKSTLIGRLLLDTGSLSSRREQEVRAGQVALPHVVDQLGREQDEGLTVNTAQAFLRHRGRDIVLVDAPGHEEFIRHMLSGASVADAAVLLVDAAEGVRDETRRHALLVTLLGIRQIAVVVNKIDGAEASHAAYTALREDIESLGRELNVSFSAVVPASALTGLNVSGVCGDWYDGPSVLDAVLAFSPPDAGGGPLRFSVQDLYEFGDEPVVAGRVERGVLCAGDTLCALPGRDTLRAHRIESFPSCRLERVDTGCAAAIVVDRPRDVKRGQVLVPTGDVLGPVDALRGRVFCIGPGSIGVGQTFPVRCATQEAQATVATIEERFDTGSLTPREGGGSLAPLELGVITCTLSRPLVVEDPAFSPALGRFIIEDDVRPIGFGMVLV